MGFLRFDGGGMAMTKRAVTQFVGVYSEGIGADDELKAQLGGCVQGELRW